MKDNAQRTALYRHFDSDGNLLYVWITFQIIARTSSHSRHARWYERVSNIKVEWFDTREEAAQAEMIAILDEAPEFNICRPLTYQEWSKRRIAIFCLRHQGKNAEAERMEADLSRHRKPRFPRELLSDVA